MLTLVELESWTGLGATVSFVTKEVFSEASVSLDVRARSFVVELST